MNMQQNHTSLAINSDLSYSQNNIRIFILGLFQLLLYLPNTRSYTTPLPGTATVKLTFNFQLEVSNACLLVDNMTTDLTNGQFHQPFYTQPLTNVCDHHATH